MSIYASHRALNMKVATALIITLFGAASAVPTPETEAQCQPRTLNFDTFGDFEGLEPVMGKSFVRDGFLFLEMVPQYRNGEIVGQQVQIATPARMTNIKVTAKMKTASVTGGIVSYMMTYGVDGDEVDFEYHGANVKRAESNFFVDGEGEIGLRGGAHDLSTPHYEFHEYAITIAEDLISFTIDGVQDTRTVYKANTWSEARGKFLFPSSPGKFLWGVWDAGKTTPLDGPTDLGVRKWAGGIVDWSRKNGDEGFAMVIDWIKIECL